MSSPAQTLPPVLPVSSRNSVLFGVMIVVFFMGGFVLWAVVAPLAEAVVASGTVKVDSSRKKIQHLEGGVVKEILVRDGDRVTRGDVLVRLDRTRAGASLAILSDGYDAGLAQEARLLAERDTLDTIVFPELLIERDGDAKVDSILKSQSALWEARRSALDGEVQIINNQISQLGGDIAGYQAQIAAKVREQSFVQDELTSMRNLFAKGLTGKQRVLELDREVAKLEGNIAELHSQISATETEIARMDLEIFQVGKSFRQGVGEELKKVQAEIYDFRERLNAAQYTYGKTEVRAPVDGVVVDSGIHTVGGVVSPGETLFEVVPENDRLVVEARINPQDIDKVRVGLPAAIKLTAFNHRTTPELFGELRYVSADALQDPQNGINYFLARIEVLETEVARLGDKLLQPGMEAEVFIRSGERTMADYLLQPLRDSFRRAWLEE